MNLGDTPTQLTGHWRVVPYSNLGGLVFRINVVWMSGENAIVRDWFPMDHLGVYNGNLESSLESDPEIRNFYNWGIKILKAKLKCHMRDQRGIELVEGSK